MYLHLFYISFPPPLQASVKTCLFCISIELSSGCFKYMGKHNRWYFVASFLQVAEGLRLSILQCMSVFHFSLLMMIILLLGCAPFYLSFQSRCTLVFHVGATMVNAHVKIQVHVFVQTHTSPSQYSGFPFTCGFTLHCFSH